MNQFQKLKFEIIIIYKQSSNVMSWYNTYNDNTRKLQDLIDTKPSLEQLLEFPQFIQTLKSFQPKVLDYITNSFQIPKQIVKYITEPPLQTDSDSRKYNLPLQTVLMIETNTTCVINCFLKIDPASQLPFFIQAFHSLLSKEQELLPLLCGYFSQMNMVIWNNRYRQAIDMIYDFKTPLLLLANHSYNKAIVNILTLYLNLDMTKNPTVILQRTNLKLQVIKTLFSQIKSSFQSSKADGGKDDRNQIVIQNIGDILIEIVQKYYLISDGKLMLDLITSEENVQLLIQILMHKKDISLTVVPIVSVLMRYYCLSSFNQEDLNNLQLSKKNQERLEMQPFVKRITELISNVSNQVISAKKFTLYHSKLLEIFIPVVELSSPKVSRIVKQSKFLQNLLSLLFIWPNLSIVHKQIQRAFFAIFCSQRAVCQGYRKHMFCQASIIEKTAGECLSKVDRIGEESLKLGWFSYLMKIVKVYSKIQTNDEEINEAIMKRAVLWDKFSASLMRPYQAICFKQLGSYEGLPDRTPNQYTVRTMGGGLEMLNPASKKLIEECINEQTMQQFLTTMPDKPEENKSPVKEDPLFVVQNIEKPPQNTLNQATIEPPPIIKESLTMNSPKPAEKEVSPMKQPMKQPATVQDPPKEQKKEETQASKSFSDFFNSKKIQVEHQIQMQRKSSKQKRLSANKSRIASPSPKKKKWDDSQQDSSSSQNTKPVGPAPKIPSQENRKQRISLTTNSNRPSIPQARSPRGSQPLPDQNRPIEGVSINIKTEESKKEDTVVNSITSLNDEKITKSISFDGNVNMSHRMSVSSLTSRESIDEIKDMLSKSAINLGELKNMKIKKEKIQGKTQKSGRKMQKIDKVFLDFLGYQY